MARRKKTELIVVHCSATSPDKDIGVAEIDKWHRERGWSGIGYHVVVRRSGLIEFGRPMDDIGAHVRGHNHHSVGVCMVGGFDAMGEPTGGFTQAQFIAMKALLPALRFAYPSAGILGHRDLSPDIDGDGIIEPHEWLKQCPCFDVALWAHNVGIV